jgi:hypothetical protein
MVEAPEPCEHCNQAGHTADERPDRETVNAELVPEPVADDVAPWWSQ